MTLKNQTLEGNLTTDPKVETKGAYLIATLLIAVNYKEKETDKVRYFKVSFFDKQAELINDNLKKGDRILILGGYTDIEFWKDKATGEGRYGEVLKYPDKFRKLAKLFYPETLLEQVTTA